VELVAGLGHKLLGHVSLLNQLVLSVSVGALVSPLAPAVEFPVITHFSLLLALVLFYVLLSFRITFELLADFLWAAAVSGAIGCKVFTITSTVFLGFRDG